MHPTQPQNHAQHHSCTHELALCDHITLLTGGFQQDTHGTPVPILMGRRWSGSLARGATRVTSHHKIPTLRRFARQAPRPPRSRVQTRYHLSCCRGVSTHHKLSLASGPSAPSSADRAPWYVRMSAWLLFHMSIHPGRCFARSSSRLLDFTLCAVISYFGSKIPWP